MSRWGTSLLAVAAAATLMACGPSHAGEGTARSHHARETLITPEAPAVQEPRQTRPNVLVIEADDMRWDDLRWMPNVRRLLQRRGLTFENSFAPYPLCCPSRASFLTGQYAHNHHVYSHEEPFGFASFRDRRTHRDRAAEGRLPHRAGRQVPQRLRRAAAARHRQPSLDYVPPGWTQWCAGSDHLWQPGDPFRGGTYAYFNLVAELERPRSMSFPGRYSTDVMAAQTRRLVTGSGAAGKPWFIWWTPVAPHHGAPVERDDPRSTRRTDGE